MAKEKVKKAYCVKRIKQEVNKMYMYAVTNGIRTFYALCRKDAEYLREKLGEDYKIVYVYTR